MMEKFGKDYDPIGLIKFGVTILLKLHVGAAPCPALARKRTNYNGGNFNKVYGPIGYN